MHVEFLPDRYVVRREVRQRTLWRTGVFTLFGGVIVVSSFLQFYQRAAVLHEIARLEPLRESARAKELRLQVLSRELQEEELVAALYSYLEFPWPRTQIIAEIVRPLPESVTLSRLRVRRENADGANLRRLAKPKQQKGRETPKATMDLEAIKTANESRQTTVTLEGVTANVLDLHRFVEQLRRSPLFLQAKLESLQSLNETGSADNSEFQVRLIVTPGYRQWRQKSQDQDVVRRTPANRLGGSS